MTKLEQRLGMTAGPAGRRKGAPRPPFLRRSIWLAQAAVLYPVFGLLAALPLDAASAFGGWVARTIGPRLGVSRPARRNLARAFPEKSAVEIEKIVRAMWDNLGRMVAELPHLKRISTLGPDARIELAGAENIERAKSATEPSLFFAAHLANWELGARVGRQHGLATTLVFRRANNPYVDRLIQRCRGPVVGELVPKGLDAARSIAETMNRGGVLGMLVDQKTNNGIRARFLDRDAMTTPVPATCAIRYRCRLYPVQVERLQGARFRVSVHAPIVANGQGGADEALALTERVNATVEGWIRRRPEQWMWLHRRWPD